MLVPTEEEELGWGPEDIPGYGARGWCRCSLAPYTPPQARGMAPPRRTPHGA